jgi:hypothetical protein
MARGDLCATTTPGERSQRGIERELGLPSVPSAGHPCRNVLPPCHFHPEAVEAQGAWPKG